MKSDYNVEEIIDLLAERTRKFTSNESTSITYEKANQLLGSIMYCLNITNNEAVYHETVEHNCLERLFIKGGSMLNENQEIREWFEEGTNMEDENLRDLLEKMAESNDIEYKIALLKHHVNSLDDFGILMEACFIEDEYEAVYKSLSKMELEILLKSIHLKKEDDEILHSWEQYLLSACK